MVKSAGFTPSVSNIKKNLLNFEEIFFIPQKSFSPKKPDTCFSIKSYFCSFKINFCMDFVTFTSKLRRRLSAFKPRNTK